MENEIYKSPASNVANPADAAETDTSAVENRNAKFVVLALFVSPLVTSLFYCTLAIVFNFVRNVGSGKGGFFETDVLVGMFAISLGISFLFSLVVGMPLNWFLIKIQRLKAHYFLVVGAITPLLFASAGSENPDVSALFIMAATGGVCLVVFWYVAAFIPSRQRP